MHKYWLAIIGILILATTAQAEDNVKLKKIDDLEQKLAFCQSDEQREAYQQNLPEDQKTSSYGSANGVYASKEECYKQVYNQIVAEFYTQRAEETKSDFATLINVLHKSYSTLYTSSDRCPEYCGRISFDIAVGEANAAIFRYVAETLDNLKQLYSDR